MHRNIRMKLISTAAAAVTAVCALTAAVPPANAGYLQDEYFSWSQMDERWSATPMGGTTIRSSGCLLTSLSIMIMDSGSLDEQAMKNLGIEKTEDFNPGVLANGYTSIGGFSGGGAINSWLDIQKLVPKVQFGADKNFISTEKDKVLAEINSLMAQGWYLIARVNTAYGGWHWVYIRGIKDGVLYMSDPANPNPDLYEVYPGGLQGEYWMLKGAEPPDMDFVPPVEFRPCVNINIESMPKTLYAYGEELDLSACTVSLSGIDPTGTEWKEPAVPLEEAENISYSTYTFQPDDPGKYDIYLSASTDYAYAETKITMTVSQPAGEYYLRDYAQADVYESEFRGEPIMTLDRDNVVDIVTCYGDLGLINSKKFIGWVDVSLLTKVNSSTKKRKTGDINNDGYIDKYDLSLLNRYLLEKGSLPDGVSSFTKDELEAADINSDGKADSSDAVAYLSALGE